MADDDKPGGGISFNISAGRDAKVDKFTGRDSTETITAGGDVVKGDKITTTTTTSSSTGLSAEDVAKLLNQQFEQINKRVEQLPNDDDEKEEIKETVKKVEEEVKKGEEAKPEKVERWLKFIAGMSDDIFQVTAATLTNPALGIATAVRKIAEKAKAETKPA